MGLLVLSGCSSARLTHEAARSRIAELARSPFVPDAIEIRRVVSQNDTQAIAETTITLAFQFRKDAPTGQWRVEAVRLGDRDWIDLNELLAAINEARKRETTEAMQKLVAGVDGYRTKNGSLPIARDIVTLTDILHPLYMGELIRADGWGNPIDYELTAPTTFRLVSRGADGLRGTPDDIVLP